MSQLDITQWEQFAQKAFAVDKACMPIFVGALTQMALLTVGELREYPPATEANQPGRLSLTTRRPMGYYERNRGWWYPVYRERTNNFVNNKRLGVIQAKRIPTVAAYKLRRTSETLSKRWAQEVTANEEAGFVEAKIGNNASYEQWVQGDKQQSRKMAAIGWETADMAVEALEGPYSEVLSQMVDEVVAYLGKA
jgi:hypothetical protein